jgi:3-oxoadipate enol-lactonase
MMDIGSGPPLVLIPGIQGRWEWMQPAIDVLARDWRVITSSLPGEPGVAAPAPVNPSSNNGDFDLFVQHVDDMFDAAGISSAAICGVSFGGLIAVRYAARRSERVRALILVSTPAPRWTLKPNFARYARWPTLGAPFFAAGAVGRFWREARAIYPKPRARLQLCASTLWRVMSAPAVPYRMSCRVRLATAQDFESDCRSVTAPTLVVTGERDLDHVVPCDETLSYLTLIRGARFQLLERTGHLGTVLAPERFAAIVSKFLHD